MNKKIVNQYIPDYVSPPGETLLEIIEELGISPSDLAQRISISNKEVDEIIAGKAPITDGVALKLEEVLGTPASFWRNREQNYRDALTRHSKKVGFKFYESQMIPKPMNQQNLKQKPTVKTSHPEKAIELDNTQKPMNIIEQMVNKIDSLNEGLKSYPIRELVNHAKDFGPYLKNQRLETNQIRKFLDAVNQLKARLSQDEDETIKQAKSEDEKAKLRFSKIEVDVVLLKPKLAYAAARQKAAKPLSDVMSVAIDKTHSTEDFERLVQLIESIIAYHKAEGGK